MRTRAALRAAAACHGRGDVAGAERHLRQAVEVCGETAALAHLLGVLNSTLGRLDEARRLLGRAVTLEPGVAAHHANLAAVLQETGAVDEALDHFRHALDLAPDSAEANNNLACALLKKGEVVWALWYLLCALALDPDHLAAASNLSGALDRLFPQRAADPEQDRGMALEVVRRALVEGEAPPSALADVGRALVTEWRVDEGMALLQRAAEEAPDDAVVWLNVGAALVRAGLFDDGQRALTRAIELAPHAEASLVLATSHMLRAMCRLMDGDWRGGWEEYEWRHVVLGGVRQCRQRPWDGEAMGGKTVLVHGEQGLGDTIQFARFLDGVRARGARVVVECLPALGRLLATHAAVDDVHCIETTDPFESVTPRPRRGPRFDRHISMLSLPFVLGCREEDLSGAVPYLHPPASMVEAWRTRVADDDGFRVGLTWAGNASQRDDRDRSCHLDQLAPLASVAGVTFYSLQKGAAARQAASSPLRLVDWTDELGDMLDTAALVATLDLVVAVDTAVAHLAGALGRPVFTLVRFSADWRWGRGGAETPWYPTMRLFRQVRPRDWEPPVAQVREALVALVAARRS